MRRIMMYNRVSADGYFAAANGNLDWVVPDPELDKAGASNLSSTDTILFGRKTYEMFESFWPNALDESGSARDPHNPQRTSPEITAMAVWINNAKKIVFSRSRKQVTWKNSRLAGEFDPRQVEKMKREPGKDMMIFGSGTIVSKLSEHGLIDEYQFVVNPTLLGNGKTLLNGLPSTVRLELLESKKFPSGNLMLRYAPTRS